MRRLVPFVVTLLIGTVPAAANVVVTIDKSTQHMTVAVDGTPRYDFVVSTGRAGYGTPNGTYHPQRLMRTYFSKKYYNSPMPHSIFFHGGFAIHGSYEISHLGGPASHGCVRLHPSNAATLYALVQQQGAGNTTIVVTGSSPSGHHVESRSYERPYGAEPGPSYYQQPPAYQQAPGYSDPRSYAPYGYGQPTYPYGRGW